MLRQIRSFLTVAKEQNLHRAAARLRMSQSALSRQIQALETEVGGRLLDRVPTGVRPTTAGYAFAEKMKLISVDYDAALVAVRRLMRGHNTQLRLGCVMSAAHAYLMPSLKIMRSKHPGTKVKLLDLSPGEQITALRSGEIDLAFLDQGVELLSRDFYVRKIAEVRSVVVLSADHRLASRKVIRVADLKDEAFVSSLEEDMPGYNNRLTQYCRKFGSFRPRFTARPQSLAEGLSLVANEDAISFLPEFVNHRSAFHLKIIPVADDVTWEISVAWQRGPYSAALSTLLEELTRPTKG